MKGLDALKYLKENKRRHWVDGDKSNEALEIIEQELKALKTIKEYSVGIVWQTECPFEDVEKVKEILKWKN